MKSHLLIKLTALIVFLLLHNNAYSFCGFYAARAGATLYNNSSKVVVAQDNQYQSITMASDFEGNVKDFAMVVPVPKVLKRNQINTVDNNIVTHLDNYTAPRLVEYFDRNPCRPQRVAMMAKPAMSPNVKKIMRRSNPKP